MLRRYLTIALRRIAKTKIFSFVNTLGLAIGITVCLSVLGYVRFERSFDSFHQNSERIYRVRYERYSDDGESVRFASSAPPVGLRIRNLFPEAELVARITKYPVSVSFGEQVFLEERLFFAETEFFRIFNFPFIHGNSLSGISSPNTAFVSRSTALKYFGNENPVGMSIRIDNKMECLITGVFDDVPPNSHIKMDIVLPWANLLLLVGNDYDEAWGHSGAFTYLLLRDGADIGDFEKKLNEIAQDEFGEILKRYKLSMSLPIQPISDIHLNSHYQQEFETNGDRITLNILLFVAFFIILIAWINYINLSTAQSLTRAKEVGLRKVLGASRSQLISQFFVEVALINLAAIIISIILVEFFQPYFQHILGVNFGKRIMEDLDSWITLGAIFLGGVFVAGLYPVLLLSSFKPILVLKGKLIKNTHGVRIRKVLVVFQFGLAMVLLSGTFAVYRQMNYMKNQNLGFSIDELVATRSPRVIPLNYQASLNSFRDEVLKNPSIHGMCIVSEVPGKQIYWDAGGIHPVGSDESKNYQIVGIDYNFVDLFGIKVIEGRNFSVDFPSDSLGLILNQTAVRWMGFADSKSAIGKQVVYWDDIYNIVGVFKDYHQQSPKIAFEPHLYRFLPQGRGNRSMFVFKIKAGSPHLVLPSIQALYNKFFPNNPFEYFFLDQYFEKQYADDEKLGKVLATFSLFSLIVTTLGILGLFSFMVNLRYKEISIRAVLGANTFKIILLFGKEFIVLIVASFIISSPLLYFAIKNWLTSFASKMQIGVSVFLFPFLFILILSALTIISMVWKTTKTNPATNLRYE